MPSEPQALVRRRIIVTGQVQGVGFRPFVFRLAREFGLTGFVRNASAGVAIEVQGLGPAVEGFAADLRSKLPPLARLVSLTSGDAEVVRGEAAFEILASEAGAGHSVLISPDVATCPDCLAEVFDPKDRRHLYPFTNCTNCGPRYTITRRIPYDRPFTSMACFPLCPECDREYRDPLDRRFHAQPNACPACGPRVWLADGSGEKISEGDEALRGLARFLAGGGIAAIKGLGGFHLACDAADEAAVRELRRRKGRPHKPLAVMVPDLDTARRIGLVSPDEEGWLSGRVRPIVLLMAREPRLLAASIAPDTGAVGVMLPYAPLHHVLLRHYAQLLDDGRPAALVMTSGNASSEPICLGNREARQRLARIADRFLFHDRDILVRADDSVLRVLPSSGEPLFYRRARGFAPSPVFLAEAGPCVLGLGPELKATLCLTKGDAAFVSQHIGDMENLDTLGFHREILAHLEAVLETSPEALVHDLHPDYMTTRLAKELSASRGIPALALQHHFAHAFAVLAENRHVGPAVCLALDGTGYGPDNTIWGGECLYVDQTTLAQRRLGHLRTFALPGGEAAVREPWRIAQGLLWELGQKEPGGGPWPWLAEFGAAAAFLPQMLEKDINSPRTSSVGRLFDAVSALLGLCISTSYEGQAAIRLEAAQDLAETNAYDCPLVLDRDPALLDTQALFAQIVRDVEAGVPAGVVARRFHLGLVAGLANLALHFARRLNLRAVGLSGGAMQNLTLAVELPKALEALGLVPLVHTQLPPNDGCIALGQAVWGMRSPGK